MIKTVKQVLERLSNQTEWCIEPERLSSVLVDRSRQQEIIDQALKELEALICHEKTKLLDEVIHQSTVNLKSAEAVAGWAELRKEQLEAEL